MRTGRPIPPLSLMDEERRTLEQWTRRPKTAQALALRARIILGCGSGKSNTIVSRELQVSGATVGKWRRRFLERRVDGLLDEPRPGAPRTVGDAEVERVLTLTLEQTPRDATHWSTRSLAAQVGLSKNTVHRIWRAFGLQPHRTETFKLSSDPLFIEKVRDIVGLYLSPPDRALVLCVDEKAQIQALDRTRPLLPMRPGQVERRTHDYVRHGTTTLFAALDARTGEVIGRCQQRHRSVEFRKFLDAIDAWLNLVERWFALLTERQIRRGAHPSTKALEEAIYRYLDVTNEQPKPFVWTKTADEILANIARFCLRTSGTGH